MIALSALALFASGHPAVAGVVAGTARDLDGVYAPRRIAVVIGVEDYSDPALQGLRFAAKDARDLGAVLDQPGLGGFDRVLVIEGHDATSAVAIQDAIAVATADLQRDDTFLLYLSGHGTLTLDPAAGSRLWFLPSDGKLEDPTHTGIDVADLESLVNALPARRRVLILDTCHNGRSGGSGVSKAAVNTRTAQLLAGMRGEPPAPRDLREVSESEARLFAAQYYQPALEDPELGNGVYTHFLIEALTVERDEADLDGDGLVDVTEAHDYARDRTIRHTGGLQVPRAEYRIVGREEIYLSGDPNRRSAAEQALVTACDQVLAKARLLIDGIPRGELPGLHAVEPGRHDVEVQAADGSTLVRRRLDLEAGTTLSVETLFERDRPRWLMVAGVRARHGSGWANFHPFAAELELARLDPWTGPDWMRTEMHLRGTAMRGDIPEQWDYTVNAGEAAAGGSVGWQRGVFSLGPQVEVVVPWRQFDNDNGSHEQATLTGAAGARALLAMPVGSRDLVLRYDVRFVPYRMDAEWTSLWHHGLALGLTSRD